VLTDIFLRRYAGRFHYGDISGFSLWPGIRRFLIQAGQIVSEELHPKIFGSPDLKEQFYKSVHNRLARELGIGFLQEAETYEARCARYLLEGYDLWNNKHGDLEEFVNARLSLVEIILREMESYVRNESVAARRDIGQMLGLRRPPTPATFTKSNKQAAINDAVGELNIRLNQANLPIHYHNGFMQLRDDDLTTKQIDEPFWELMQDQKWVNVDTDIKEAVDRRDSGDRDAPLCAAKALEADPKFASIPTI